MKKVIAVLIGTILVYGTLCAKETGADLKNGTVAVSKNKNEQAKQTFLINTEIYYTDHDDDYFLQKKYSLAEGTYTLDPVIEKLELYLEGKAGFRTEDYRFENGYAATSEQKMGIYVAVQAGVNYRIIDNMSIGAEVTMLDSENHTKGMEMVLNYKF